MKTVPATQQDYLHGLTIVHRSIGELHPSPNNARTHSKKQIRQIAESIKQFTFVVPVITTPDGQIIMGHGRFEAAKQLGMTEVPTICIEHLNNAQLRALMIADNHLAELAGWDKEILAIEFQELRALDLDFDLSITGFEIPEIDLMIHGMAPESNSLEEVPVVDVNQPVISRPGDLWILKQHKLMCGDARIDTIYSTLMTVEQSDMVFTDPPFNVPINGHVSGLGSIKHDEFVMATGEMSTKEFITFLATVFTQLAHHSSLGSLHYIFMDWRHMDEILTAGNSVYSSLLNLCIWNKDNGGMGSMYRSKHELVFVFKNGKDPHINNIQLGRFGRYRTNVWDYPGVNSFGGGRMDELRMHPTVKPVALVADAILDATNRGDIVLDPFGGSGTTIIAAEEVGRQARIIELDPRYVDVSIRRWQDSTGGSAVHADTGLCFDDITNQRLAGYSSALSSTTTAEVPTHA